MMNKLKMKRNGSMLGTVLFGLIAVVVIIGVLTASTFIHVDTGRVSLIRNTYDGTIRVGPVGPIDRPFLKNPYFEDVIVIYTAVDNVYMWSKFDDNFKETSHGDWESPIGITKDGIKIAMDVNFFFRVSPSIGDKQLINLYQNYPALDYKERVIIPIVRQVVRDVIANETFDAVISQREKLPNTISKEVVAKILSNPTLNGIIQVDASSFQILEIQMPKSIQDVLQAKKNSETTIITASNNRQATIINADAERQKAILQSQGVATAKLIEANATQKAIFTVLQSLGCEDDIKCQQQASQLYLTLNTYQTIAQTNSKAIFMIGLKDGSPIIYQLPP